MDTKLMSAEQIARVAASGKRVVTAMVNTDSVYTTYPDGHYVMPPTLRRP
jgi:hypothetical protein